MLIDKANYNHSNLKLMKKISKNQQNLSKINEYSKLISCF